MDDAKIERSGTIYRSDMILRYYSAQRFLSLVTFCSLLIIPIAPIHADKSTSI